MTLHAPMRVLLLRVAIAVPAPKRSDASDRGAPIQRRRQFKADGKYGHDPMVEVITQILTSQHFLAPVNLRCS
jgi:hypothetical protein